MYVGNTNRLIREHQFIFKFAICTLVIFMAMAFAYDYNGSNNAMETSETTRTLSWTNDDNIMLPSASNLGISNITWVNGTGTYVEGMKFVIRVAFSNPGDTGVLAINATPNFATYAYLSANASASIAIKAYGYGRIDFLITVGINPTNNASVLIKATWSGTENVTNTVYTGGSNPNNLNVAIQSKSNVGITSITFRTGTGTYVGGMTFAIRVAFQNQGGTAATGVTAAPNFATYPGLSLGNSSSSVTISASNTGYVDFLIQVASNALSNASVLVRATWTGTEQYSGRALSGASGISVPPNLNVAIQRQSNVTVSSITTGSGTYVGGMTFVTRVGFSNTGGTAANSITATLSYGGYTSLSANSSASISLGVGATGYVDFLVTVSVAASSQNPVTISTSWSGTEAISTRSISGSSSAGTNLQVAIQSQATVSITSITYRTGTGTYVGGMTFVVRIVFSNAGGTATNSITAVLAYGGYSSLSANASASIAISAGGTSSIDFFITVVGSATTQNPVTINATWTGTEAISTRPLSGNSGGNNLNVAIQSQANVAITSITYRTGAGTYVGGMTFVLRFDLQNTGGTTANNVYIPARIDGGINFGSFTDFSYNSSNSITISAGGTGFINFLITLGPGALSNPSVPITAMCNGTEAISNRVWGNLGAINLVVAIQAQSNVGITSITTGSGTYVGGMTFVLRVRFYNGGGTACLQMPPLLLLLPRVAMVLSIFSSP
jgi:hypothetical protein